MFIIICVILLILCVPDDSKYSYHDTISVKLYSKHKIGVVSVVWEHTVSAHGAATAKSGGSLNILLLLYVFIMLQKFVIFTNNQFDCMLKKRDRW